MLLQQSSFFSPSRILLGEGSHEQISNIVEEYAASKILLVVDKALTNTDFFKDIVEVLKQGNIKYKTFSDIDPDPKDTSVEAAAKISQELKPDIVLAIGGGSTIDVGKAAAIVYTNSGRINDYVGIEKYKTPPLPLVAIPTTAGTGSEVSGSCVITNSESGLKMSIRHASLNPARVAILDPLALSSLPAKVASHSGLDAFTHAFESYISRNANPFTDSINLHAIRLISSNIRQFVANRANKQAAINMLCGSAMAGMTFGQTGLGNAHCMGRFIGAKYHVSHGLSVASSLPLVAKFNKISDPARYANVAAAMGANISGLSINEAADMGVDMISSLCYELGIPQHLSEIGMEEKHIPELAKLCVGADYDRWNPRSTSLNDFTQLFSEAL